MGGRVNDRSILLSSFQPPQTPQEGRLPGRPGSPLKRVLIISAINHHLEGVTESNLHHTGTSLNRCKISEGGITRPIERIESLNKSVNRGKPLSVSNVENLPPQLEGVFLAPGHGP